jgi:hypothetical protein
MSLMVGGYCYIGCVGDQLCRNIVVRIIQVYLPIFLAECNTDKGFSKTRAGCTSPVIGVILSTVSRAYQCIAAAAEYLSTTHIELETKMGTFIHKSPNMTLITDCNCRE